MTQRPPGTMAPDAMRWEPLIDDPGAPPDRLSVVAYHYVRDLPRTKFPNIRGLLRDAFRRQVESLAERYEMATLESALEYLAGRFHPRRDLCLLTFDDGLKEHHTDVLPILDEHRVQGVFLLTTACMDGLVASVHKNHFLLASLDFPEYRRAVENQLAERFPSIDIEIDTAVAVRTHRFDSPEVARFKYLLNYHLPAEVRNDILDTLFAEHLGDAQVFARELYLSWEDAHEMQSAGMSLGGHSHRHRALTTLTPEQRRQDLSTCADTLRSRLRAQSLWPFSYPHGDTDPPTRTLLRTLGFACGFTVRIGPKTSAHRDLFDIQRIDATEVTT